MITEEDIKDLQIAIDDENTQIVKRLLKKINKEKYDIWKHLFTDGLYYFNIVEYIIVHKRRYGKFIKKYINYTIKDPIRMIKIYCNYSYCNYRLINAVIQKAYLNEEDLLQFNFDNKVLNTYKLNINYRRKRLLIMLYYMKFIKYPRFDKNLLTVIDKFLLLEIGVCLNPVLF